MDLDNKLNQIPHVYYVNIDNRIDRRDYMESQFEKWKIKNFTRVSSSKYLASEFDLWKHKLHDLDSLLSIKNLHIPTLANSITHVEMIKTWLETTNDQYMIMMEDDYDLSLIQYWNFDWTYLMNNIPYDWDCIQLGFESSTYISFFLHPIMPFGTYFGPCLINRDYAEKIVRLHYIDDKFVTILKINHHTLQSKPFVISADYFIPHNGRTYCIPLITCNTELDSYENRIKRNISHHEESKKLYYDWWQNKHHNYSLEEFFSYGKENDLEMTFKVNIENTNITYSYS